MDGRNQFGCNCRSGNAPGLRRMVQFIKRALRAVGFAPFTSVLSSNCKNRGARGSDDWDEDDGCRTRNGKLVDHILSRTLSPSSRLAA